MKKAQDGMQPLMDRVILRTKAVDKKTTGGLYIPDSAEGETYVRGEVVAVGPGGYTPKGFPIPMSVKVGDIVIFDKQYGAEIEVNNEKLVVIREVGLLAVVN